MKKIGMFFVPVMLAMVLGIGLDPGAARADYAEYYYDYPACASFPPPFTPIAEGDFLKVGLLDPVPAKTQMCSLGEVEVDPIVTLLEGRPEYTWKTLWVNENQWGGYFHIMKRPGDTHFRARVFVGMNETATILRGGMWLARIDDEGDAVDWRFYGPGATYFIPAGTTVEWYQTVDDVWKLFNNDIPRQLPPG